jgi:NTE family protein
LSQETKRKVIMLDFIAQLNPMISKEFQTGSVPTFDVSQNDPTSDADLKACVLKHPQGFSYMHVVHSQEAAADEKRLLALMTFLTYRYDYLLLRMPSNVSDFTYRIIKQADLVYIYAGSRVSDLQGAADIVREFTERFAFNKNELRIILPEDEETREGIEKKEEVIGGRVFTVLPSREKKLERYQGSVRYLVKEFSGRLLGLALGSGAAYGLAHIGVLKVLEREGIFPDIISGSSIGALVGGIWGAGYNSADLEQIAKSIDLKTGFFKLIGFQDMSLPHNGFFKGNQAVKFIDSYLNNKTFQDLRIPVKIVAANLFTSEEVVLDTGRVSDAIRASISIPGIFRPYLLQGKQLIDGGVIDPLPVSLLHSLGVKKVIAVNVLPGPKDRIEKNRISEEDAQRQLRAATEKGAMHKAWVSSLHKVYDRYSINVFNVIMNTIQFLEYEIAKSSGAQADIMIHPIVRDAHWAEFYSADKFIKVGEEKAMEQLEEIKKLIAE